VLLAFVVTLLAGLATSVGGLLAVHDKVRERGTLAFALAFSAGAMILVSFVEILPKGIRDLTEQHGNRTGQALVYLTFFIGVGLVALIDRLLPASLNPSEVEGREGSLSANDLTRNVRLMRSGVLVAAVVSLHNLPEGLSGFLATLDDPSVGITLAIAIAIHNVPEGIAVAAPIYGATGNRRKAFWYASGSGIAEPLGALFGYFVLTLFLSEDAFGLVFGLVAGMMVFISIDELMPAAQRYQTRPHQSVYGLVGGMFVVALSLVLLA
jgi:ZIP family zinc transporter